MRCSHARLEHRAQGTSAKHGKASADGGGPADDGAGQCPTEVDSGVALWATRPAKVPASASAKSAKGLTASRWGGVRTGRPPLPPFSVRLDAPGQRHGQQPVSETADPRSSQTGQVIRGLR